MGREREDREWMPQFKDKSSVIADYEASMGRGSTSQNFDRGDEGSKRYEGNSRRFED